MVDRLLFHCCVVVMLFLFQNASTCKDLVGAQQNSSNLHAAPEIRSTQQNNNMILTAITFRTLQYSRAASIVLSHGCVQSNGCVEYKS